MSRTAPLTSFSPSYFVFLVLFPSVTLGRFAHSCLLIDGLISRFLETSIRFLTLLSRSMTFYGLLLLSGSFRLVCI